MPESRRKFLLIAFQAIIFMLLVALYGASIDRMRHFPQSTDFYKFYQSARFFWDKKDIYAPIQVELPVLAEKPHGQQTTVTKLLHPNLNSPFYTLCLSAFGLLTFHQAILIWSLLSLCGGLMAVIAIAYNINEIRANLSILLGLWILMLAYFPSWTNFQLGQFGFILLLLVAAIWLAFKKGVEQAAGVILGLALSLKIFLGIFLIYFAVYRRWRLLLWSVGVFFLCNLLSLSIFGIPTYKKFLFLLHDMPWYAGSWNASLTGFLTRFFGGSGNNSLFQLPWLSRLLASALALFLLCALVRLGRARASGMVAEHFDAGFSLSIVAMLLISPYAWVYYFPVLLIPTIVLWQLSGKFPEGKWYRLWLASAWILSSIPTDLIAAEDIPQDQAPLWFFTSGGFYSYALLIMAGLLLSILWRMQKKPEPSLEPPTSHGEAG